jgi:hypothetical protein
MYNNHITPQELCLEPEREHLWTWLIPPISFVYLAAALYGSLELMITILRIRVSQNVGEILLTFQADKIMTQVY